MAMGVNTLFPPTDNKLVRQALNYAADRKRFTDQIFKGIVRPLSLPWDPSSLAYEASKENLLHLRSRQGPIAAATGRRDVGRTGLSGFAEHAGVGPDVADLPELTWRRVGIKLNIVKLDQAAWLDQVNNRKYHGFWASTMADRHGRADERPESRPRRPIRTPTTRATRTTSTRQLIRSAASEPDPAKRKPIYSQVNDILLEDAVRDGGDHVPAQDGGV